jgi:hypothetical protein
MHSVVFEQAISAIKHPKADGLPNDTYTVGVNNYLMINLIFYTKYSTVRKEHDVVVCKITEQFFFIQVTQYKAKHN